MHEIIDITWWRLGLVGSCLLALLLLAHVYRLRLGGTLLLASLRGPLQLFAIGYALTAIFSIQNPLLVVATLLIMLAVAAHTGSGRLRTRLKGLRLATAAALVVGSSISLVMMSQLIVGLEPWYDPQYLIPFGGMLLGNSMNAASLGGERFQEELRARCDEIETRLALGFTGPESVHPMLRRSLRAALIPMLNSLMVAGIVQLPGMMTGQILSGVDPVLAVKYQILIYFLLLLSVAISALVFLLQLRGRYLTRAHQLRRDLLS